MEVKDIAEYEEKDSRLAKSTIAELHQEIERLQNKLETEKKTTQIFIDELSNITEIALKKENIIKEDKKIERIGANNYEWNYQYPQKTPQAVVDNLELVRQKINEIIDYLEENK